MAKSRAGEARSEQLLAGLEIKSLPLLLSKLKASLQKTLGRGLSWTDIDERGYVFLTRSREEEFGINKFGKLPVVRFILDSSNVPTHWFGMLLKIDQTTDTLYLTNASLHIYKGRALGPSKTLLLRVEWNPVQPIREKHGQPHIQVHGVGQEARIPAPTTDFATINDDVVPEVENTPYHHVHLPMAARFHENDAKCVVTLTSEAMLIAWAGLATSYLETEIRGIWPSARRVAI